MADNSVSVGTHTVVGAVAGGLLGVAVIAAAPILLPGIGLTALGATGLALVGALPWLPAAGGAYWGYLRGKKAQAAE
jgi:hypothetical protein